MSESPRGPGFVVRQTCHPRLSKTYPVPPGTLVTIFCLLRPLKWPLGVNLASCVPPLPVPTLSGANALSFPSQHGPGCSSGR